MSTSPFELFRRNLKPLMIALTVLAMLAFVVLPAVDSWVRQGGPGGGDNAVVASYKGGEFTTGPVNKFTQNHYRTLQFLQELALETAQAGGTLKVPGFEFDEQRQQISQWGINSQPSAPTSVSVQLDAQRALDLGFDLDHSAVKVWLNNFSDNKFTDTQINQILRRATDRQMGQHDMLEQLRMHLLANAIQQTSLAGLYASGRSTIPPAEQFALYKRLNERAKAIAYPVLVDDFLADTNATPSEAEIQRVYDEGRDAYPNETSDKPGFRRRSAAKFEVVSGDFETFISRLAAEVPEEKLREEYDRQVAAGGFVVPDSMPGENTVPPGDVPPNESDEAAEEQPAEPAEGSPAEPMEDTPAEPAEETPAEPAEETPAEPMEETPAEPAEETPAEPAEETPAEPAEETPAEPAEETPAEPAEETPAEPAEETPAEPAEETPAEPMEETPAEPAEETPAEPAEETPAEPAEETPAEPAEETPAEPAEETPAEPEAEDQSSRMAGSEVRLVAFRPQEDAADTEPQADEPETPADEPEAPADEPEAPADEPEAPADEPKAPAKVRPFEEVRQQIAEQMVTPDAFSKVRDGIAKVKEVMRKYSVEFAIYQAAVEDDTAEGPAPERPDVEALAKQYGLSYELIGPHDAVSIQDTDVGQSAVMTGQFQMGASFPQLMFGGQEGLYSPVETTNFRSGQSFVSWKTEQTPDEVPVLVEVRDEVIAAIRYQEAQELARKAAEELAAEANASPDKPLQEIVPEDRQEFVFDDLGEFPWMLWLGPGRMPMIWNLEALNRVGDDFMRQVFTQPLNEYGVAPNETKSVYYVVKTTQRTPEPEKLRDQFMQATERDTVRGMMTQETLELRQAYQIELTEQLGLEFNEDE
ncbi:hypothetical protein [Roseimaritima ulvae]|uniref:Periplasmic folding chaperone n=1 Tax=Roseimaritima ulvae TaxID=980254 RepID=A0A5B9R4J1_9BACT|nr:hypothetical protein [Roseimaritima ulvae]QEG41381.1 hypothetical protein UC8_34010 [Roseimaritima ulvae]